MERIVKRGSVPPETRRRILAELPNAVDQVHGRALAFATRTYVRVHVGGASSQEVAMWLVQEAIRRTMEGTRVWKVDTVTLEVHLIQTVRSIVDGCRRKEARRDPTPVDENFSLVCEDVWTPGSLAEAKQECQRFEGALLEAAGDDEALLKLVELIMDGAETPGVVTKQTGWPKDQTTALFQKLRRRVRRILAKQEGPQ